jgi:RNA recognition motif-containing protein
MAETLATIGPQLPGEAMDVTEDKTMPEAQNLNDGSDSDSDSDDDDAQDTLQLQTLETELSTNPANYDAHVQYIRVLRKEGDIEKMRRAREAMNEIFPLTPAMWQEWAKDEASLTSGADAFHAIEKLYERGVSDYLSVPLWCDYIKFVKERDPVVHESSAEGVSKARNLFEKALTAAGCHVGEGSKIWEFYIEFEQSILKTIAESDIEGREKQVQRIRNLFHRQLSVPLVDLKSTLLTYKAWEAEQGNNSLQLNTDSLDGIPSHVASSYQKALEILTARTHLEDQISRHDSSDSEKLQNFMTYLKFEESSGNPVSVQVLYERAVTEFPISGDLWLDYTRYLDKTLKASKILKDIYYRATKNCPWVGELWVRFLLSLEGSHASEEEIASVFEKSLLCTFSSLDEYLNIFLTRVDGLRRRISAKLDSDTLDYGAIRQTFQRAFDYLSPQLKNTTALLQMISYWARLESNLGKDVVAARGVWECLLKISGSMLESWQGYISMEIEMGHINEARSLYKRCYSKRFTGTGSEDICHSWVRFEREYGTLEDFHHAVQKVTPRLEELQLYKLQQESKYMPTTSDQTEIPAKKNTREKRKPVSDITDEQSPAKRPKDSSAKPLKEVDTKQKTRGNNSNEENINKKPQTSKAVSEDEKSKDSKFERPQYNDKCTAFISNLSLKANYEDLHKFFSDVGGVTSIRLLMDKFTKKSRGLAYADFSDDEHLASALAKNKQMLLGKRVSIARSNPKQNKKGKGEHGQGDKQNQGASRLDSGDQKMNDDNLELKGKNTFAMPRTVRPLGFINKDKPNTEQVQEGEAEIPKSNDEFRKMLFKK